MYSKLQPHDAKQEKPPLFEVEQLLLADGTQVLGYWSGSAWKSEGIEREVVEWMEIDIEVIARNGIIQ